MRPQADAGGAAGAAVAYDYWPAQQPAAGDPDWAKWSPGALKSMKVLQAGAVLSETVYAYDDPGKRLHTVTVKDGAGAVIRTFTYAYKAGTELVASVTTSGATTAYGYEYETAGSNQALRTARLHSVSTGSAYAATYAYFNNDQRQSESVTRSLPGGGAATAGTTYTYNARDELTGVASTGTGGPAAGTWAFDGVGNRVNPAAGGGAHPTLGAANNLNRYANFGYDARGNTTDDGAFAYTYDALDRLTSATAKTGGGKEEYSYDPDDHLAEVRRFSNGALTGSTRFAYAGDQLVAEFDGATNVLTRGYTWGPTGLLAVTDYTAATPTTYTAVPDGAGNTVALLDSTGAVAASFTYGAWGEMQSATGPASNLCPVGWGGGVWRSSLTGNTFNGKRVYSPAAGRFLQRDPIAEAGGVGLYVYTGNDPVNFRDASGLAPEPVDDYTKSVDERMARVRKEWPYLDPTQQAALRLGIVAHDIGLRQEAVAARAAGEQAWLDGTLNQIFSRQSTIDGHGQALSGLRDQAAQLKRAKDTLNLRWGEAFGIRSIPLDGSYHWGLDYHRLPGEIGTPDAAANAAGWMLASGGGPTLASTGDEALVFAPFLAGLQTGFAKAGTGIILGAGGQVGEKLVAGELRDSAFLSEADLLRAKLGPASVSHPAEYTKTMEMLAQEQVEVVPRVGSMAYLPNPGGPGRLVLDPDASVGALRHEVRHFLDVKEAGYKPLSYYFENPMERWHFEYRGYMEEVKIARQMRAFDVGRGIVKQMREVRTNILAE